MDEIKIETIDKKPEKEQKQQQDEELGDSDDSRTVTNCSKKIKLDDGARQPVQASLQQAQPQQHQPAQQQQQQQQQQQAHRQQFPEVNRSLQQTGIPANYCTYCNKELCNKYFMKTHMQKMHGINLDDCPREAANSGGVVCDICQKELCSKYFLKVHKSNTHGITDFTGSSASSQAANAATAVAAIALTNYSLNQVQNRAALNLALNRQLQSRQAAVLMNAAAAAVTHQRDHLNASNLIGHLQQQHPPQQLPTNQHQQLTTQHQQPQQQQQLQHQHQQQQIDLHAAQQVSLLPANQRTSAADFQAAFPAALLAATAGPTLLAAQLAQQQQQQQHNQHQQQQQNSFPLSLDNSHSLSQQLQECQPTHPSADPAPFSYPTTNEDPLDTGDDSSDTDSQNSQDQHKSSSASITASANSALQQQALLNAAAVLNPAAAAMIAMQQQQQQLQLQHQQQQQQLQQQHQQRLQQQQQQQQQQLSSGSRQQTAIDLRNQPNGQHSHYTEACPICDRRFKSIKWLQSHVMNDHKNEISNLFNWLVQIILMNGEGGESAGLSNGTHNNGNGNSNQAGGSINDSVASRSGSNGALDIDWQQVVMQQQSQVSSMAAIAAAAAAGATAATGTSRTGSGGDV